MRVIHLAPNLFDGVRGLDASLPWDTITNHYRGLGYALGYLETVARASAIYGRTHSHPLFYALGRL
jgi:hypothetical protein